MGLTDDQRAMLRLLAQREEGYEDIAALKGISVEEVRAEVKAALAALAEGSPAVGHGPGETTQTSPAQTSPTAGPVAGGSPPPHPPEGQPPTPPAEERSVPAPASAQAAQRSARRATATPAQARAAGTPRSGLSREQRRLGELIGGTLVVLLLVLFATDTIDLGGGDSSESDDAASTGQIATSSGKQPTQAVLEPVDGSDASGQALFGRLKNQVVLAIAAKGLAPSGQGQSYAVSLVRSPEERIPIAAAKVGKSGELGGQYPIAPNVLGLLANGFDQMEISLVVNKELRGALTEAQEDEATPEFESTEVLRGEVTGPIVDQ